MSLFDSRGFSAASFLRHSLAKIMKAFAGLGIFCLPGDLSSSQLLLAFVVPYGGFPCTWTCKILVGISPIAWGLWSIRILFASWPPPPLSLKTANTFDLFAAAAAGDDSLTSWLLVTTSEESLESTSSSSYISSSESSVSFGKFFVKL